MKRQAKVTAAQHSYIVAAHQLIKSAHYTGYSSRFSINEYITMHQRAHNELKRLGQPVHDKQK
jgi:hypothetical protein